MTTDLDVAELHTARERIGIEQIETVLALRRVRRRAKLLETMARRRYLDAVQRRLLDEVLGQEAELRRHAATLSQHRRLLDDAIESATVNRILKSVRS